MNESNQPVRASQFLHNINKAFEIASSGNSNAPVLAAMLDLAEAYLSLEPATLPEAECYNPIFFLHTLWCQLNDSGIELAAKEIAVFLEGDFSETDQIEILNSLRDVLLTAKQVSAISDDLHDPCCINNLINSALLYAFMTSGDTSWVDMEEWDCLDIFIAEAWGASDEEKRSLVASTLQAQIEKSSVEFSKSIFEDLLNGRITTPNTFWDET